jgi:hypothetical protein
MTLISTDDADDINHCDMTDQGAVRCGGLYPAAFVYGLTVPNASEDMRGILAILSQNNSRAGTSFWGWYQAAKALDPRVASHPVTIITTPAEVLAADIFKYRMLYIASGMWVLHVMMRSCVV